MKLCFDASSKREKKFSFALDRYSEDSRSEFQKFFLSVEISVATNPADDY
jgi:hypothetical protein